QRLRQLRQQQVQGWQYCLFDNQPIKGAQRSVISTLKETPQSQNNFKDSWRGILTLPVVAQDSIPTTFHPLHLCLIRCQILTWEGIGAVQLNMLVKGSQDAPRKRE